MIIEILSPSTVKRDFVEKFSLYEEAGVKEYWIVHPDTEAITVFLLMNDGKYDAGSLYEFEAQVPVHIFNDSLIDLTDIFSSFFK
jgi:Uma2 family endonuclease